jgi:hypothetical protein
MVRENTAFRGRERESMTSLAAYDTEEDWSELVKKWEDGISLEEVTKAQLKEYTRIKIWFYEIEAISDFTLWNLFRMDFKDFIAETFSKLDGSTI